MKNELKFALRRFAPGWDWEVDSPVMYLSSRGFYTRKSDALRGMDRAMRRVSAGWVDWKFRGKYDVKVVDFT